MNKLVREISGILFTCYNLNLAKHFYQRATSDVLVDALEQIIISLRWMENKTYVCVFFFTVIRFSIMGYSKQDDVFCVRAVCLLYRAVSNTVSGPNL